MKEELWWQIGLLHSVPSLSLLIKFKPNLTIVRKDAMVKELHKSIEPCLPLRTLSLYLKTMLSLRFTLWFLAGFQKVQTTKKERFLEHCTNAAMQLLPSNVSKALKIAGQEAAFDSLRAPRRIPCDFESFAFAIFGGDFNNDSGTRNSPQMPSLEKVHRMKQAFEELEHCPTWCSIIAALLSVVECKEGTYWPVGFICSVGEPEDTKVLFIGDSHPRMNFLIVNGLGQLPDAYLISATAYNEKVLLGDALPLC